MALDPDTNCQAPSSADCRAAQRKPCTYVWRLQGGLVICPNSKGPASHLQVGRCAWKAAASSRCWQVLHRTRCSWLCLFMPAQLAASRSSRASGHEQVVVAILANSAALGM